MATKWICRINLNGVWFDSKPGTVHQAEAAMSLARDYGLEASILGVEE